MYFKENLPIKTRVDLKTLCAEGIVTEITLHLKTIFFVGLYRPHGMSSDNFVLFMQRLESLLDYRPISLLPICEKIFEKLIFDVMYEFLNKNNLLTPKQSSFRPGDPTINHLLSITNEIH